MRRANRFVTGAREYVAEKKKCEQSLIERANAGMDSATKKPPSWETPDELDRQTEFVKNCFASGAQQNWTYSKTGEMSL